MSRIGNKAIEIPEKVKVECKDGFLAVTGPLGTLNQSIPAGLVVVVKDGVATVQAPKRTRSNAGFQGMVRAILANMIHGVVTGYEKDLQINGVGYKAELKGDVLTCALGFSHTKSIKMPKGIKCTVGKTATEIKIAGIDKQLVGQVAAQIRSFKVPEPYKAKGVKYSTETIRRKVGKAGAK